MDDTSQKEQRINIPQDGILPERDAQNNSEQAQLMREAVEEQWRLEHGAPKPVVALLGPHLAAQVDLLVYYADDRLERQVSLSQAWLFALDAYMLEKPFVIYGIGDTPAHDALLIHYDGDILRSEYDVEWARAWIKAGIEVIQEVAAIRMTRPGPTSREQESAPDAPASDELPSAEETRPNSPDLEVAGSN